MNESQRSDSIKMKPENHHKRHINHKNNMFQFLVLIAFLQCFTGCLQGEEKLDESPDECLFDELSAHVPLLVLLVQMILNLVR